MSDERRMIAARPASPHAGADIRIQKAANVFRDDMHSQRRPQRIDIETAQILVEVPRRADSVTDSIPTVVRVCSSAPSRGRRPDRHHARYRDGAAITETGWRQGVRPENDLPSSKVRLKDTEARHASLDSRAFKRGVTKSRKARSFSGK